MSRFSQFAASTPTGKVDQFLSGTSPNGYLQLNGQCVSKTTYASLYTVVGDLEPPITDSITLCALSSCGTASGGYNWCNLSGAISSWGPNCITKFSLNIGCESGTNRGVYRMCYATADLQCGTLPDVCTCCGAGWCLCVDSSNVFSYHQDGILYVAASIRACGSNQSKVALWNFTCKCLVSIYRGPQNDQYLIQPVDYSRVVNVCNGPYNRKYYWVCTPAVIYPGCCNCEIGYKSHEDCFCTSMNNSMRQFAPNLGHAVRYSKTHCAGKEPIAMISIGQSYCQSNYSSCYCCGILIWDFTTFATKVDNGCCYFSSMGCTCPNTTWNLPYSWSYSSKIPCFGSGVNCKDFFLTVVPYWSYGCGPAYACCRTWLFTYHVADTVSLAVSGSFPTAVCTCVDIKNNVLTPSCGPIQTGVTTCLSGVSHYYYNEKTCKYWGRSIKFACAYCLPTVFNTSMSYSTYDFCYCTGQTPVAHGATANCSPLSATDDPQKYTANTVPFNPGSSTGSAVLYGVSTLGPTSNVFMLPSVSSAVTGLAYYIKS